jgi:transposase InsO family protein
MFLVLIDAHSKWIETSPTTNSTSHIVIQCLRSCFARFGIPDIIVTDNGTCFVSEEFQAFLNLNGIYHVTSAPYHPASNGLAERAVQIIKRGLKKESHGDIHTRLAKILFSYRISVQSTTDTSPSELLMGRRL